jgi:hypothetical protein
MRVAVETNERKERMKKTLSSLTQVAGVCDTVGKGNGRDQNNRGANRVKRD